MRVVLDTNVIVSGLISEHGYPARLLDAVRYRRVTLLTAPAQLEEVDAVLARPKIAGRLTPGAHDTLLGFFADVADVLDTPLPAVEASPDPDDNRILAIAVLGRADLFVTGDKRHLLPLREHQGVPIMEPVEAVAGLGQRGLMAN